MSQLLSFLSSRGLWNFVGLLALSVLIWVAGPLLAIGEVRPLESERARSWLIALLFLVWLARLIWRKWREGRLNARLLGQLRRPASKSQARVELGNPDIKVLSERFDEAIRLLKDMRFEGGRPRWRLARFSKQYLYQLPWYIFIGAPGSGKTTALVNAGLKFPLAHRFGKAALRGVGGTRNCDWWFTDDAVLLDTAGRYTTHESDPAGDQEEWKGFLGLLKRFRGRQPINGVMLTVSLGDLLSASDSERIEHAGILRKRLQELREQLGLRFPVYVLVTKTDLMSGFEQYFASCTHESLKQVWGFTFPHADTQSDGFNLPASFNTEYQLLQQRLVQGLPDVLDAEADADNRALAYLLPQQFAGLRPVLGHFLGDVFQSSRFESSLMLRGVYFTSGTQGGQTFDQVAGELTRHLNLEGVRAAASTLAPETGNGRSFFLHDLLKKVIFPEAPLAGRNLKWERRYRYMQWTGYSLISLVLAACVAGMATSYRNNMHYLAQVEAGMPAVEQLARETRITQPGDLRSAMPYMAALYALPAAGGLDTADPPLSYRFGLYQGKKVQSGVDGIYRSAQQQILTPQAARRIEAALRTAAKDDLEYSYEALRAYLMMYDAQRYDADFLHTWLLADVQKQLSPDYTRAQFETLSDHIRRLLESAVRSSPFPQDEGLLQRARAELDSHPLARRAYSRLRRILLKEAQSDITLNSLGGPTAMSVFTRASGRPLSEGIPALYSYKGYWTIFSPRIEEVAQQLRRDDAWVLDVNRTLPGAAPTAGLALDIRRLYLADFVTIWDAYLNDLKLIPAGSLLESIEMARTLSASNSPLVALMRGVARETTLLRDVDIDERSLLDRARDRVNTTQSSLVEMFGPVGGAVDARDSASGEKVEAMVDSHFAMYRDMVTAVPGSEPPVAATTGLLNELYGYLTATDAALRSGGPKPSSPVVSKLQAEAGRMPKPVAGMLTQLAMRASKEVSTVERRNLGQNVASQVGAFCRGSIAGRYPFSRRSTRDAAPNDMARLFGPGGMMDAFFQKHLAEHVDMSASRWRFKPGIDGEPGEMASYLDAFQRAAVINSVFFASGAGEPSYKVTIRPLQMDDDINQFIMSVGGQVVRYAHGPQVGTTIQWPGTSGNNRAGIELLPQTGTSGISASGPWALNRLLDKAALQRGPSPEVTIATFDISGRRVVLEITAHSVKSPFRLPEMAAFSCPGRG